MSNIDKRALREAAEKAAPGPWRYLKSTPFMDAEISAENHTRVVNLLAGDVTADNSEFIAAANPATVLALLDELEASQAKNALVAGGIEAAIKLQERAEAAEKQIAEHDRKCDEQYLLGMRTGWNFGMLEDADGFDTAYASRSKLIETERAASSPKGE